VTLENEFVDAAPLYAVEAAGIPVYPRPATLATIQDKLTQKETLSLQGVAVPPFRGVESLDDVRRSAEDFGYPIVLKTRYGGYDGYGNATLHHPDDLPAAWERLSKGGRKLMVEAFVPFACELAVMVLRARNGEIRAYPVVETVQQNHICHVVRAPAPLSAELLYRAELLAVRAVQLLEGVGVFGVELFQLSDDTILLNEIAPRPHNSGHYSIEACYTSQFENHLRAVLGLPLGSTALRFPSAVMVNVLGKRSGEVNFDGVRAALALDRVHIHLYGKREVRPGRKMGHITVCGDDLAACEALALQAADLITL
jgi:5-(carboxyamino)imidazole ribonucleotide synthase